MINVLNIGITDRNACFTKVLRDFGYESVSYESENIHLITDKVKKDDYLMIRGNASGIEEKDLTRFLKKLHKEGIHVLLSFHTELWKKISGARPFLIVPEREDLEKSYHEIHNENDAMRILVKIHDHNHGNVLAVLKNEKKAVFVCSDGRQFVSQLPYDEIREDVYAKESMMAGFLAAYLSFHDYVKTFHYAVSAYSISAEKGKPAERIETEDTYQMMKEKKIWMK